jgi:hypothetical protein
MLRLIYMIRSCLNRALIEVKECRAGGGDDHAPLDSRPSFPLIFRHLW